MPDSNALADAVADILSSVERSRRHTRAPFGPWCETIRGWLGETEVNVAITHIGGTPSLDIGYLHTPVGLRREGHARKALLKLLDIADQMGVDTVLKPEPQDHCTDQKELEAFYRGSGFRPRFGMDHWRRARPRQERSDDELAKMGITREEYEEYRSLSEASEIEGTQDDVSS